MTVTRAAFGLALACAAGVCAQAAPHPAAGQKSCFYARNISSWAPVGRSTVNLRVGVSDYYELKLLGECNNIDWTQGIGVEHRGSSWICSGLDATLIVPQQTGVPPMRCAVSSVRRLSPDEVKALPPNQKP
jgi:hypothetical protein